MQIQCPRCKGTGRDSKIVAECELCEGRGHIQEDTNYNQYIHKQKKEN